MTETLTPAKHPGLARARELAAAGDRDAAASFLEESLRGGLWAHDDLWLEFTALPDDTADHDRLRQLWLDSPPKCRDLPTPMVVVARAALLDGEHAEARLLLRKAILSLSKHDKRLSNRLRRLRGAKSVRTVSPPGSAGDTASYFDLYNAVAVRDGASRNRCVTTLIALGEGEWLGRL